MEDQNIYVRRERKKRNQINYVRNASFENYIRKVLSNLTREDRASISEKSVKIIDDILKNFFTDLASEAKQLKVSSKTRTLTDWDIQHAVAVVLNGEVAKHSLMEGNKAVQMFRNMMRRM